MGIARTQETQETTFMYKKQPLKKRQNKKISCHIYIKNKLLIVPLAIKTKQKNKVQGSLGTLRLLLPRHFIGSPPHLGEALSSMIQKKRN